MLELFQQASEDLVFGRIGKEAIGQSKISVSQCDVAIADCWSLKLV